MLACCGKYSGFFFGLENPWTGEMSDENQVSGELGTSGSKKTVL